MPFSQAAKPDRRLRELAKAVAATPVDPHRPLLICDVDEVLALFMEGLGKFLAGKGHELRVDRFALFQNIYVPGAREHLPIEKGQKLFDAFFKARTHDVEPVPGAADALARLSQRASVVILTNAPANARVGRTDWLARHSFAHPMLLNEGLKGPAVELLAARTSGPVAFVDDLLPNLDSVKATCPRVHTFQSVADRRLRRLAPARPEAHRRYDDWRELEPAIAEALGV